MNDGAALIIREGQNPAHYTSRLCLPPQMCVSSSKRSAITSISAPLLSMSPQPHAVGGAGGAILDTAGGCGGANIRAVCLVAIWGQYVAENSVNNRTYYINMYDLRYFQPFSHLEEMNNLIVFWRTGRSFLTLLSEWLAAACPPQGAAGGQERAGRATEPIAQNRAYY